MSAGGRRRRSRWAHGGQEWEDGEDGEEEAESDEDGPQRGRGYGAREHNRLRQRARRRLCHIMRWCEKGILVKGFIEVFRDGLHAWVLVLAFGATTWLSLKILGQLSVFAHPNTALHGHARRRGGRDRDDLLHEFDTDDLPSDTAGWFNVFIATKIARVASSALARILVWWPLANFIAALGAAFIVAICNAVSPFALHLIVDFVEMAVLVQSGNFSRIFA